MSMSSPTASAEALAQYLSSGGQPVPQAPSIHLGPGEVQYFATSFSGYTWEGKDVSYRQFRMWLITPAGCLMAIFMLPINLTLRLIASLRGGERWRRTFGGHLYATNHRLIANTGNQYMNFSYREIAQLHIEGRGIYIALHNSPAVFIDVGAANPWLYVLVNHLVQTAPTFG